MKLRIATSKGTLLEYLNTLSDYVYILEQKIESF